jgi:hypothetical protein
MQLVILTDISYKYGHGTVRVTGANRTVWLCGQQWDLTPSQLDTQMLRILLDQSFATSIRFFFQDAFDTRFQKKLVRFAEGAVVYD